MVSSYHGRSTQRIMSIQGMIIQNDKSMKADQGEIILFPLFESLRKDFSVISKIIWMRNKYFTLPFYYTTITIRTF